MSEPIAPAEGDPEDAAPFVYASAPGWVKPADAEQMKGGAAAVAFVTPSGAAVKPVETEAQLVARREEEIRAREAAAREQGVREGLGRAQAEAEGALARQRDAVTQALREFAGAQEKYFRAVETEVVALSLAIARKILRREAHIDPLLLTGAVRVALEQVSAAQHVRLRVHPSQTSIWRDSLEHLDWRVVPELSGDASLDPTQCQIDTELGVTDLSLEMQLKEIEQGFFDLLAQRPGPK